MKLTIPEKEYKKYKMLYRSGMPLLIAGCIFGQILIGYIGGILLMIAGTAIFVYGLIGLNNLFVCPHCNSKMITNAKKDFKKGKTPDQCPVCKRKVFVEIK